MIRKRLSANEDSVIVTFEIPGSVWADRIHLVGDLNDWDRESLPFRLTRQNTWQVEVELERGREVRFRYLVDGAHWRSDRDADLYARGEDGMVDSVIITRAQSPRAA
jgi:1,4-alpha-glucan branching enzyme